MHLKQDKVDRLVLVLRTLRLECPVPHGAWCPEELRITAQVIIDSKQAEQLEKPVPAKPEPPRF